MQPAFFNVAQDSEDAKKILHELDDFVVGQIQLMAEVSSKGSSEALELFGGRRYYCPSLDKVVCRGER